LNGGDLKTGDWELRTKGGKSWPAAAQLIGKAKTWSLPGDRSSGVSAIEMIRPVVVSCRLE